MTNSPESLTSQKISSLPLAWSCVRGMIAIVPRVLRRGWRQLLALYLLEFAAGQFFSYATEYLRLIGREDILYIASIALFELVFTMLWSAAWVVSLSKIAEAELATAQSTMPLSELAGYFQQVVIEQIRSLASVLWRTPLLLFPALAQYVRLAFVPFVVLFDPDYAVGRVDALKKSRALSRGQFWLLALAVTCSLLLPTAIEQIIHAGGSEWIWENPLRVSSSAILTFFVDTSTTLFLFLMFRAIFSGYAAFSMARNQESLPGTHV